MQHALPVNSMSEGITAIKDLATIFAIVVGAIWFLRRWQLGRRATITVTCEFFPVDPVGAVLAEIDVTMKNVGDVRQDLRGFDLFVNALDDSAIDGSDSRLIEFKRSLIRLSPIEVNDADIRPNVERHFTFPILLQHPGPLIQVGVAFRYNLDKPALNRVNKVFSTKPRVQST